MSEENRLGNNIRRLREAFGITQEKLANQLYLEKSAVSNYENGHRNPDMETLKRIASYFGETADRLLNEDYSYLEKGDLRITKEKFASRIRILNTILPIFSSEKALRNQSFQKAHAAHNALRKAIFAGIDSGIGSQELSQTFQESNDGYDDAREDPGVELEAMANQISLLLMYYCINMVVPEMIQKGSVFVEQLKQLNGEWRKEFERIDTFPGNSSDEETSSWCTPFEVSEMLTSLKRSGEWAELADHYLAITYYLGLADSSLGYELSQRIGYEMLKAFRSVHNQYAERYFAVASEISADLSTQTVDDKA